MNEFQQIETKLNEFATKHGGRIITMEQYESEPSYGREKRNILWDDGIFEKAVFISPAALVDNGWDFSLLASLADKGDVKGEIPFWQKYLLEGVAFSEIEGQIDSLLLEAETLLSAVKVEDMRLDWFYLDGKLVDARIQ